MIKSTHYRQRNITDKNLSYSETEWEKNTISQKLV